MKGSWHHEIGRPSVNAIDFCLLERVKDERTVSDSGNFILHGTRIVVPKSLEDHLVNLAHEGRQGLVKTKALLREKIWFPHIMRSLPDCYSRVQKRTLADVATLSSALERNKCCFC